MHLTTPLRTQPIFQTDERQGSQAIPSGDRDKLSSPRGAVQCQPFLSTRAVLLVTYCCQIRRLPSAPGEQSLRSSISLNPIVVAILIHRGLSRNQTEKITCKALASRYLYKTRGATPPGNTAAALHSRISSCRTCGLTSASTGTCARIGNANGAIAGAPSNPRAHARTIFDGSASSPKRMNPWRDHQCEANQAAGETGRLAWNRLVAEARLPWPDEFKQQRVIDSEISQLCLRQRLCYKFHRCTHRHRRSRDIRPICQAASSARNP